MLYHGSLKNRFVPFLEAENVEQTVIVRERLTTWDVQRLRAEGWCLTGMTYWMKERQYNKAVAAFMAGPGEQLPTNNFACVPLFCLMSLGY